MILLKRDGWIFEAPPPPPSVVTKINCSFSLGTTLIGLAVFSMAELTVVNVDNEQPVDLMLPFEAEFPLSRKPRGTRQGSRIPAWYFDKMTGTKSIFYFFQES